MPHINLIAPGHYRYTCSCGREVDYFTDGETERPKIVPRCFECSRHVDVEPDAPTLP